MKTKLLQIFEQYKGDYVSGATMSEQLNCSRTAIWKHIKELRNVGYEIHSSPGRGYKIVKKAEGVRPYEISLYKNTKKIGNELTYVESTDSTQRIAREKVAASVAEGHVIIANEQTKGRGRLGRTWYTTRDTSIAMSIILRPIIPPEHAPQLTLLTAVAVVRAIEKTTALQCDIKWPNDILINNKKVVGILTEMQAEADMVTAVMVGIGVNVNEQLRDIQDDITHIATSLALEKGVEISRAQLIASILAEFEQLYYLFLKEGFSVIRPLWEAHCTTIGSYIYAKTVQDERYGFVKGITEDGGLILVDENGDNHHIYSANIEIAHNKE